MQQRRQQITELINREGQVSFTELKRAFPEISEMTLRTDLKYLDEHNAIVRIHGGAKSIDTIAGTDGLLARRTVRNQDSKKMIAQKAIQLLRGKSSVFIDSGSTTTVFSKFIPDEPRQIYTCGISCAMELSTLSQPSVYIVGGRLNRYSLSIAGSSSVLELKSHYFDICFMGATSFSPERGFCCESEEDCILKRVVLSQSEYTVMLMDSSKFGMMNTHSICPVSGVNAIVTDDKITQEQREYFTNQGIQVF